MINFLRKITPKPLLQAYHFCLAHVAALWYGYPSREMIVIGVTGTNGKTTTSYFLAKALEANSQKTGCTTTALFKVADKEWLNDAKMTMPGRFRLQKLLRQMVKAGCGYAVIETSSQGLLQYRHVGIDYDVAVFTNLTPEHIEAHGGFAAYKQAKRLLFEQVAKSKKKIIQGKEVPKGAILNADSEHAAFYEATPGLKTLGWYGLDQSRGMTASHLVLLPRESRFDVQGHSVDLHLPGRFNVANALAALATCEALHVPLDEAARQLSLIVRVPGRVQFIEQGQPWTVMIDYAPEPESLRQLYALIDRVPHERLIHVLGSAGGGRDVARRPILGAMAGKMAQVVIVTNEDPYDDDPRLIMDQVAKGAVEVGKIMNQDVFIIEDRKQAINRAMEMAQPKDLVLMTGKGAETWMCVADGKKLPWNEEQAAREALEKMGYVRS